MSIEATEHDRNETGGLNRRGAELISCEMAWRFYIPWKDLPERSRLVFSNWLNVAPFDVVVSEIERASTLDCADPSYEIWKRLRRLDPRNSSAFAARRVNDAHRVRTWQAPQATA